MKKAIQIILFIFCISVSVVAQQKQVTKRSNAASTTPMHCLIKGEVIDRPESNQLILLKKGEDLRVTGKYIPIINGKFEYKLDCQNLEAYELIFFEENRS